MIDNPPQSSPPRGLLGNRRPRERRFFPRRYGGNYIPLVACLLLLYLLVPPVIGNDHWSGFLVSVLLLATIAVGVRGATDNPRILTAGGILVVGVGVMLAIGTLTEIDAVIFCGIALIALAFLAVQVAILQDIVPQSTVTVDTIFGSVGTYLAMLFMWACVYTSIGILDPDAFSGSGYIPDQVQGYLYFSTVTQTTVGYGDITPATDLARELAGLQALFGQLYVAILVAWIVGRAVSQVTPTEST